MKTRPQKLAYLKAKYWADPESARARDRERYRARAARTAKKRAIQPPIDGEQWLPTEYPAYEVSDLGRVRNVAEVRGSWPGRILKPSAGPNGYPMVAITVGDKRRRLLVSRLVAQAFHGPPVGARKEVNHKDRNPGNNRADNLEWVTRIENLSHAVGRPLTDLSDADVRTIRTIGFSQPCTKTAREYGVAKSTILRIIHRKSRRHVL